MRKAMICVSMMLAVFLVWPMLFGQKGEGAASAATAPTAVPKPAPAVAVQLVPAPTKVSLPGNGAPKSCYRQYQVAFAACSRDDQACHIKATDQWDLCEATGFWPQ